MSAYLCKLHPGLNMKKIRSEIMMRIFEYIKVRMRMHLYLQVNSNLLITSHNIIAFMQII